MQFDIERKRSKLRIEYRSNKRTWIGRIKFGDGTRSPSVDLLTDDEATAQRVYDQWFDTGTPPDAGGKQPFAVAAEQFIQDQLAAGIPAAKDRATRLRSFAIPRIGHVQVRELKKHHVAGVLDAMADAGLLAGYILKMRSDISRLLARLARRGAIEHNVALGLELGEHVETDDRPRVILTDDEIVRFRRRGFASELDMMALFARDLGGHRTSDLHAADWEDFDTVAWRTCKVRRPKTDPKTGRRRRLERAGKSRATRAYEKVTHGIPATVKGPLIAWWEAHGCPTAGPVFPLRRGPNAGKRKTGKGISYAQPLRDALWSEGIVRPLPGYERAVGDERRNFCALQVDTDETRAVDFHSFRRAYVTALADAGASMQDALDLTGHTVATTSHGYRGARLIETPAGALPGAKQAKERAKVGVLNVLYAAAAQAHEGRELEDLPEDPKPRR
ncbi:MAG TPA: hypothetical protein VGK73_01610 [Polyangiaceae bacterium]